MGRWKVKKKGYENIIWCVFIINIQGVKTSVESQKALLLFKEIFPWVTRRALYAVQCIIIALAPFSISTDDWRLYFVFNDSVFTLKCRCFFFFFFFFFFFYQSSLFCLHLAFWNLLYIYQSVSDTCFSLIPYFKLAQLCGIIMFRCESVGTPL